MDKNFRSRLIQVVAVIEIMALLSAAKEMASTRSFDGNLKRPGPAQEIRTEKLSVQYGDEIRDFDVEIYPVRLSEKETEELLDAAVKEIDNSFKGDNVSLDSCIYDLEPKTLYSDGRVKAAWRFDNYDVIDLGGHLNLGRIDEKTLVEASVQLECEGVQRTYNFSFIVIPADAGTDMGFRYLLEEKIKENNEIYRMDENLILPEKLDGKPVKWSKKMSSTPLYLAIFGVIAGVALYFAKKEDEAKKKRERLEQLESDYPDIVNMLSLYVGAGISLKGAFGRIASAYINEKESGRSHIRPGFEGICMLCRDMEDGKGEMEAYHDFGKRMGQKDFRKLSLIITSNLKKGTTALISQLEKEDHQAFEMRKMKAKVAGEEASTKLLLPMTGLLMIVMVVLVFPAMFKMSM